MSSTNPRPLPKFSASDIARFWSKVEVGRINSCWPWKASRFTKWKLARGNDDPTYGSFWAQGHTWHANRVAYYLFFGEDPGYLLACHLCDTPACCNGYHLAKGTHQQNTNDMLSKDRAYSPSGHDHYAHRVTETQVREILSLRGHLSFRKISERFNVTMGCIQGIMDGKNWKHIERPAFIRRGLVPQIYAPELTAEQMLKVPGKRVNGNKTNIQLKKRSGISRPQPDRKDEKPIPVQALGSVQLRNAAETGQSQQSAPASTAQVRR